MIDIWDNESTGLEMKLEFQIQAESRVMGIDWYTSHDGQHLLAVGVKDHVQVFVKSLSNAGSSWTKLSDKYQDNFIIDDIEYQMVDLSKLLITFLSNRMIYFV